MKRLTILSLLVFLLVTPAGATEPGASWFNTYANDERQLTLTDGQWNAFEPDSFSVQTVGIYRLDESGFPPVFSGADGGFTSLYSGVVEIHGKCVQPKARAVQVRAVFRDGRYHDVADTYDRVFSFFVAFMAGDFQLQARSDLFTTLKCNIVLERMP